MISERQTAFLRRAENRRKRSIARELRRSKREEKKAIEISTNKTVKSSPTTESNKPTTRLIPKSKSGCGSCGKKASKFKQQVKKATPIKPKVETKSAQKSPTKTIKNVVRAKPRLTITPKSKK